MSTRNISVQQGLLLQCQGVEIKVYNDDHSPHSYVFIFWEGYVVKILRIFINC